MASGDYAGFTLDKNDGTAVGSEKKLYGNGYVTWDLSAYGTYWFKETHVPDGYKKMDDIKVEAKYDQKYCLERTKEKITWEITLTTTGIVVGSSKQVYSFDRVNTKICGTIKLTKSGLEGLAAGDYAGFTLYFSNGSAFGGEKQLTGNGTVIWSNVPYGTGYYIRETHAPEGYDPIADITGINITSQGQTVTFSRENCKIPGEITLNKTGLGSTDTAGFTLYDSSGDVVGVEIQITGNDSIIWPDLPWDTYK